MYASQTKRLCVRGTSSDETRVPQHSSSTSPAIGATAASSSSSSSEATAIGQANLLDNRVQLSPSQHSSIHQLQPRASVVIGGATTARGDANMTASASSTNGDAIESTSITSSSTPNANSSFPCQQQEQSPQHQESCQQPLPPSPPPPLSQDEDDVQAEPSADTFESLEHQLINKLANETIEEAKLELLLSIRNLITACNKKKDSIVCNPNFNKILSLIDDDSPSPTVKTQLALLICSVAKSGEHNVKFLNKSLVDDKILNLILNSQDHALIEACLRCMRSIMSWPKVSRTWLIYENQSQERRSSSNGGNDSTKDISLNQSSLQKMIAYAQSSNSFIVQECVADIFAATCGRNKDQVLLYKASAIPCILQLLESPSQRVTIAALEWLMQICLRNSLISQEVIGQKCPSGTTILDRLVHLMSKDSCHDFQYLSARCYTNIYRALVNDSLKGDERITSHVLPTLARLIQSDKNPRLRVKTAHCIAYLIERDVKLQDTASNCEHLIDSLADMLRDRCNSVVGQLINGSVEISPRAGRRTLMYLTQPALSLQRNSNLNQIKKDALDDTDFELHLEMKRAAFSALAAVASSSEPIRKRVFNKRLEIMNPLVSALKDSDPETLRSVLTCLLSLSRSVQQLRTSFTDTDVYNSLKDLLKTTSNDILILVLAILCNVSLDFSPGKQYFLDDATIETLCKLTRESDSYLRLHGMWILMNMVYQLKDEGLKFKILNCLGIKHLLSFLETEDDEIAVKTLGFLRNILSQRTHIDSIMGHFGEKVMSSLLRILEKPSSQKIKEQTLCVLTNIADGPQSKTFIMDRRVLLHLAQIICDEQAGDLRLIAICCITNLALREDEGSVERRDEMKKFGIEDKLKSMLNTDDPILSDRVRTAYNQFSISIDDKFTS